MKLRIPKIIKNKYLLIFILFLIWICFFDDKNIFFFQYSQQKELKKLKQLKAYYVKEIEKNHQYANELKNNMQVVEKLAREKYLFKKQHEDIYIIEK